MDRLFKKIFFIILGIIYVPLALFSHLTYPWWLGLKKGKDWQKILFYVLAPIYSPIAFFLYLTYEWWADMGKNF